MAKHIIFLKEAAEATFSMSQCILNHHDKVLLAHPHQSGDVKMATQRVHQMLAQKVTQFECWKIRMNSMQKRMENVINLVRGPYSLSFLSPQGAKRYCAPCLGVRSAKCDITDNCAGTEL